MTGGAEFLRHTSALSRALRLDVLGRFSMPAYMMDIVLIAALASVLLAVTGVAQDVSGIAYCCPRPSSRWR